jgi:hypothetical protein
MNVSTATGISLIVLLGCARPRTQRLPNWPTTPGVAAAQEERLFIHLLAPASYTAPQTPAHRMVTARIHPAEYFAISVGDPDDPFTNHWDGALTVARLSKTGVPEARPLEPFWNSGDAILAGRIDAVNGKFIAQLQGRSHTTLNYFHGEMELEKPVYGQGCLFRNDAIWGVWFVLSANPDCGQFLRALHDGSLQPPSLVDKDSPAAKGWVGHESKGTLQILDAEPDAASDATPPHR